MTAKDKPKVIVILGPTAVGKTALSVKLAQTFGGEIVSADSRQVYKGLDIGSGKVTQSEMGGVPHHLLDVADPQKTYTASDFVRNGTEAIQHILNNGRIPIIVGGTGFYIDALLGTVALTEVAPNEALRAKLETLSVEELNAQLTSLDPQRASSIDAQNSRRLIRAIEIATAGKPVPAPKKDSPYSAIFIGLSIPIEELREKIRTRITSRLEQGMLEEAKKLNREGLTFERMDDLGLEYRYMARHLKGDISYDEMCQAIERESVRYARRQMTWFKRNKEILWFRPEETEKMIEYIEERVNE